MSKASDIIRQFEGFDDEWDLEALKRRQRQHQGADDEPDYEEKGVSQQDLEDAETRARDKRNFGDEDFYSIRGRVPPKGQSVARGSSYKPRPTPSMDRKDWWKTKRSTKVTRSPEGILKCTYHETDVVEAKINPNTGKPDYVILRTGGHASLTTKTRMNQMSSKYELGYRVYQKAYDWFVEYQGQTIKFEGDELTLKNKHAAE